MEVKSEDCYEYCAEDELFSKRAVEQFPSASRNSTSVKRHHFQKSIRQLHSSDFYGDSINQPSPQTPLASNSDILERIYFTVPSKKHAFNIGELESPTPCSRSGGMRGVGDKWPVFNARSTHEELPQEFCVSGPSLTNYSWSSVYIPEFLRYSTRASDPFQGRLWEKNGPSCELLDVSRIWRNMSPDDGCGVAFLHQAFKDALKLVLCQESLHPVKSFHCGKFEYEVTANLADITAHMRKLFDEACPYTAAMNLNGGTKGLVERFISTRDIFVDQQDPFLDILPSERLLFRSYLQKRDPLLRFSLQTNAMNQTAEVCIKWQPPLLTFDNFVSKIQEGREYVLTPHYHRRFSPSPSSSSGDMQLSFVCSSSWLSWNPVTRSFHGIVPSFVEAHSQSTLGITENSSEKKVSIRIQALAKFFLTSTILLEQTVRANVNIYVELRRPIVFKESTTTISIDPIRYPNPIQYNFQDWRPASANSRKEQWGGFGSPSQHQLCRRRKTSRFSEIFEFLNERSRIKKAEADSNSEAGVKDEDAARVLNETDDNIERTFTNSDAQKHSKKKSLGRMCTERSEGKKTNDEMLEGKKTMHIREKQPGDEVDIVRCEY